MASGISAAREIDLESWSRAGQFHLFRTYDRPHFATTARVDVTALMTRGKPQGVSPYRAFIHAIGAGVHAVPALKMRFSGDRERVFEYDEIALSATVPRPGDTFGYAYIPLYRGLGRVSTESCKAIIEETTRGADLGANTGQRFDLAYLSCLPWIDFTALDNALPGPDDCIPRFSWGKFVEGLGWALELRGRGPGPSCAGGRICRSASSSKPRKKASTASPQSERSAQTVGLRAAAALAYFVNKRLTQLTPSTKQCCGLRPEQVIRAFFGHTMNGSVSA
jgi:chloramphenicol O-acetyltransferase type A